MQPLCGAGERAFFGDGHKRAKMPDLHARIVRVIPSKAAIPVWQHTVSVQA
jgi:hypothetical protein